MWFVLGSLEVRHVGNLPQLAFSNSFLHQRRHELGGAQRGSQHLDAITTPRCRPQFFPRETDASSNLLKRLPSLKSSSTLDAALVLPPSSCAPRFEIIWLAWCSPRSMGECFPRWTFKSLDSTEGPGGTARLHPGGACESSLNNPPNSTKMQAHAFSKRCGGQALPTRAGLWQFPGCCLAAPDQVAEWSTNISTNLHRGS